MTIELDTTLAQAEVLFLSFAQLLADVDRRQAEETAASSNSIRRRGGADTNGSDAVVKAVIPILSDDLRDVLKAGR
jgi:hypothetical protein